MKTVYKNTVLLIVLLLVFPVLKGSTEDFSEQSFVIAKVNSYDYNNNKIWDLLGARNWTGLEIDLIRTGNEATLRNGHINFSSVLNKVEELAKQNQARVIPVFVNYSGDIHFLDSIIQNSKLSQHIFFLPQGEKWPSTEYLLQANRRIIFYVNGDITNESRILHHLQDYVLQIGAARLTPNSALLGTESNINRELLKINNLHQLPVGVSASRLPKNQVPDYINFLLDSWTKVGKKPNFISVGNVLSSFDFIVEQLNSFEAVKGLVRTAGKNIERAYWKNPDILLTGAKFSFPIRGGEEVILSPFAPGYSMTPAQLVITSEMQIPDSYSVFASPMELSEGLSARFRFEESATDDINPKRIFQGKDFSFSEDIDRGTVLRLPENASLTLGDPNLYGLPNSSFTVGCFVKFTEILEFGDNAILGNNDTGFRRGLHLILRSGHPYFGLWANDYMSDQVLKANEWYHLVWRYTIETGQQAIFVNGQFIGGSEGHLPYSGTSDLHIGSALSSGASLRGYIDNLHIWNRPLGKEEIMRLSSDEEINLEAKEQGNNALSAPIRNIALVLIMFVLIWIAWFSYRKVKRKKARDQVETFALPEENRIQFFGEFKAINKEGVVVSDLFTPKVKELFVCIVINTLQNGIGAAIHEVNETLWYGIDEKKAANNRAVTLNKLRKILSQFEKVDLLASGGHLQIKTSGTFFCDYMEAYALCQIPEGMTRNQLFQFFQLVKRGRLLKGLEWIWLDNIRGFTGNQVIDNLLKLAVAYQKELKLKEVEKVAQRILDYDNLNEEAIYFQVWALQKANNTHLAKFNFKSFCSNYEKCMGEDYPRSFSEFNRYYSERFM